MQIEITEDYLAAQGLSKTFPKRFWNKVNKNGPIPKHQPNLGQCWIWTGCVCNGRYGYIVAKTKKVILAHRGSWLINVGAIANSLCVLHKCDNEQCVNPAHLFTGTQLENMRDCSLKGRKLPWNAVLSIHKAREIRKLFATGLFKKADLARTFGVKGNTLIPLLNGITWAEHPGRDVI